MLLYVVLEEPLTPEIRKKIALFCNVKKEAVIEAADAPTIYEVPRHDAEKLILSASGK